MIIKATVSNKVNNFMPTKHLNRLKKLFNILSPNINYAKIEYLCLTKE